MRGCSFTVTVVDGESPSILNCPTQTIYDNATSLMSHKLVTWPEVKATDNSLETPALKLYVGKFKMEFSLNWGYNSKPLT